MIYIGNGKYLRGVPARDLTAEEVRLFGKQRLIDSKLYKPKAAKVKPIVIEPPKENEVIEKENE